MMSVRDNFISRWVGVVAVLLVFSKTTISEAAILVPTAISGAISYGYGYNRSQRGGSSESQTISGTISGTGYYWQPWFISFSAGLSLAFDRSSYSTASTSSNNRAWGGSLGVDVFPVSRFPFSLTLSHSDSLLQNTQPIGGTASRTFTSTRLLARQTYLARSGYSSHLTWSHGRFNSEDSTSTSDVYTADTRKSFTKSALMATASYTTSRDSNSSVRPESWGVQLNHNYVPGNQFGLSNFVSAAGSNTKSDLSSSQAQTTQASSTFSWRPEYKSYSFSGGARIAYNDITQDTNTTSSKSSSNLASLSLGVNYRLSRKVAVLLTAGGSGGYNKKDSTETTNTNANASLGTSYNSDQYSIGGFQYGWNVGGGLTGQTSNKKENNGSTTSKSSQSSGALGLNAGQRASRNWSVGRATSLGLTLSQSVGGSQDDTGRGAFGLGEGISFSGSKRGQSGSSFAGINLSHSYNEADSTAAGDTSKTRSQSLFSSLNVSRNQTINRLSALTGNLSLQWSKQTFSNQDSFINSSGNANLNYRHMRAFGIYALQYNSTASYSVLLNQGRDRLASMYWYNAFQYNVGLLAMTLDLDFDREANNLSHMSLRFRATRSF